MSCHTKSNQDEINFLQIIDRNGLSETISSVEKLKKYTKTDFELPQSYQKVLRIYKKDEKGDIKSKLTSYHDNGQLFKYLEIKNARAFGKYKEWHPNGNLKIDAFVIDGKADVDFQSDWLFDGICTVYDEKGILISEFNYEKGYLQGIANFYHDNHKIKKAIPYTNNEINGEVLEYNKNEECISKTSYKNGKKHGQSIGYWSKNNIYYLEDYDLDLLINAQYFEKSRVKISTIKNGDGQKAIFKDGKLFQLIEFKSGIAEGKIQTFSTNGHLVNEYYQKNSQKDGRETQYYNQNEISNPTKKNFIKLEINWDNGIIHGTAKTWYKNSQLESQKEYSHNKKNGSHFAWYENGSVMFIEEYENDALIKGSYFQVNQKKPTSTIINGNGIASLFDSRGRFLKKISYKEGMPLQ